jgi:transcriptional regulator with XRE-family HTH domain
MGMGDAPPAWLRRGGDTATDDVAVVIRDQRRALGMSQSAVAAAMSLTQQFLSQIENGSRSVTFDQRRRFSQVLDIAPERPRDSSSILGTTSPTSDTRLHLVGRDARHRDGCRSRVSRSRRLPR